MFQYESGFRHCCCPVLSQNTLCKLLNWVLQRFQGGRKWGSSFHHRPGTLGVEELLKIHNISTDWKNSHASNMMGSQCVQAALHYPSFFGKNSCALRVADPWPLWFYSGKWVELWPEKRSFREWIKRGPGGNWWDWDRHSTLGWVSSKFKELYTIGLEN